MKLVINQKNTPEFSHVQQTTNAFQFNKNKKSRPNLVETNGQ